MIDDPHDEWDEDEFVDHYDARFLALFGQACWDKLVRHPAAKGAYLPLYLGMNAASYLARDLDRMYGNDPGTVTIGDVELGPSELEDRLRYLGIESIILTADEFPAVLPKPQAVVKRFGPHGHPTSPFKSRRR